MFKVIVGIALIPAAGPLSVLRALRVLRVLRLLSVMPSMRTVILAELKAVKSELAAMHQSMSDLRRVLGEK